MVSLNLLSKLTIVSSNLISQSFLLMERTEKILANLKFTSLMHKFWLEECEGHEPLISS
jgi:hypothetical protein